MRQVTDKSKLIDNRRATETQAFTGDVSTLKKRVADYERYIKTLKELVDQEKTQELVEALHEEERRQVPEVGQLLSDIQRVEMEVRDAKRYNINA